MGLTAERLRGCGVFVASGFCSQRACVRIRAEMDRGAASRAQIYADGYCVEEDVRRAFDVDVDETVVNDVQRALDTIRAQVAQFFGTPLSGEEGPGFVRYACGGFYRVHCDIAPGCEEFPRRISVVVFLTSAGVDFEGGTLRLHGRRTREIAPRAGMLVAFPSDVPHEVLPVTAGVRDTIVDWFY
jgi:predicted 2-oxoglutarate/Fe(II)-dependent dioxygenase YbiX